jgi:hypothetical protein
MTKEDCVQEALKTNTGTTTVINIAMDEWSQ